MFVIRAAIEKDFINPELIYVKYANVIVKINKRNCVIKINKHPLRVLI